MYKRQLLENSELEEYRDNHMSYYQAFAARCDEQLTGTSEALAWQALDNEWANIRTAYDATVEKRDFEKAAEILLSLGWYSLYSVRWEVFAKALQLLRVPGVERLTRYADLCGMAAIDCYITVHPDALKWAEKGLQASKQSPSKFCRTVLLGVLTNNQLDSKRAETVTKEWLAEVQESESPDLQEWIWAHGFRAFHLCTERRPAEAIPLCEKLLNHARWSGSASATAVACWAHGMTQLIDGIDSANAVWDDGVGWAQSLYGGHLLTHMIVGLQLHVSAGRGELPQVTTLCRKALLAAKEQHYLAGTSHLFGVTAIVLSRNNDTDTAARLLGAMVANGHTPRSNAIGFLHKLLGDRLEAKMSAGAHLSISNAADIALQHLDQYIEA